MDDYVPTVDPYVAQEPTSVTATRCDRCGKVTRDLVKRYKRYDVNKGGTMEVEVVCLTCHEETTMDDYGRTMNYLLGGQGPVGTTALDLIPTSELIAALERRFDCFVFAGTILLSQAPNGDRQEQRVVRVKGHDLIQAGLVQLLRRHCAPQALPPNQGGMIGGGA